MFIAAGSYQRFTGSCYSENVDTMFIPNAALPHGDKS
jgi:hypothetical protein